jgi:hypothetical protein
VPVYEYECGSCKSPRRPTRTDYLFRRRTINDDGTWTDHGETPPETVPCRKCQSPAKRIVSAPKFRMAKYGFVDEATGIRFEDESAMNRHYEANGLARTEDAGSWIDQQVARVMAEEEASERRFMADSSSKRIPVASSTNPYFAIRNFGADTMRLAGDWHLRHGTVSGGVSPWSVHVPSSLMVRRRNR